MAGISLTPPNHLLPAEVPILSLFSQRSQSREIRPDMDTETIADILSDRLIEVVKKDLAATSKLKKTSKNT